MITMQKIMLISVVLWLSTNLISSDDSTLYVKTIYQHEIYNGRNTSRKVAIKQEMKDSDGELFREVFYNPKTKQVDYVLYYFYNSDGSVRLIEKVDDHEKLYEYYKHYYKKNKLKSIEHFSYNSGNNSSELLSIQKYTYKKNISYLKETDNSNNMIKTIESVYENKKLKKETLMDNRRDSAHLKIIYLDYLNDLIQKETEIVISEKSDTGIYYKHYAYNDNNLVDTITTYNSKNEFLRNTLFKYTQNGSLINQRTIGKNNYYLENLTYELRKYFRDLPRKKPQF